jgi:primosomal protein N'
MRMHDIRTGRYDVTVTSGPSFTTRREEAAEQMMNLIQSYPDAAPVIGDLLAKNLDWPGADEIAKRLEKMLPPEIRGDDGQIPPAVQQRMQQMGQALNALHSQLQEAMDKKDIDRAKIAVETYKAETERMQALTPAMPPEGIALIVRQTLAEIAGQVLPDAEVAPAGPGAFAQPAMGQAA